MTVQEIINAAEAAKTAGAANLGATPELIWDLIKALGENAGGGGGGGSSYLVYTALLDQAGIDVPTVDNLANTSGLTFPAWQRSSPGVYSVISNEVYSGDFSKIMFPPFDGEQQVGVPLADDTPISYVYTFGWSDDGNGHLQIDLKIFLSEDYSSPVDFSDISYGGKLPINMYFY